MVIPKYAKNQVNFMCLIFKFYSRKQLENQIISRYANLPKLLCK